MKVNRSGRTVSATMVVNVAEAFAAVEQVQRRANVNAAQIQIDLFAIALDTYELQVGSFPFRTIGLAGFTDSAGRSQGSGQMGGPVPYQGHPLGPLEQAVSVRLSWQA